jgi:hypothetical protein
MLETGEAELPSPPPPHQIWGGGILPPLFRRLIGSTPGVLLLFPCLHSFVVGVVCCPLCHTLEQADAPRCIANTPETLRKVASTMRR